MKILIFEHKNFGIEDICETFNSFGYTYKVISTELIYNRINKDFNQIFEKEISDGYDCVFTFNYDPIVSTNCNIHNIPYISYVYDSPLITLYSCTIINPCNYVFIFDKMQYNELKKAGINTVYYMPLAVNSKRLKRQLSSSLNIHSSYSSDISFVGSMYNEKHNLFDKFKTTSPYTQGYLDGIMKAQLNVYGYYFIEELLTDNVLEEMRKAVPFTPNKDGVETDTYVYAYYFIARKLAAMERYELLSALSDKFNVALYTSNPTDNMPYIDNRGPVDYYNNMPYVFANSKINLNISLRSIRSGIPLRCMDIMGCGGFLLSNYQEDFYEYFTPGQDMVLYDSKDDLINKCSYYLTHENERKQIAANGLGKIEENHTYDVRLNEMFNIVFN